MYCILREHELYSFESYVLTQLTVFLHYSNTALRLRFLSALRCFIFFC